MAAKDDKKRIEPRVHLQAESRVSLVSSQRDHPQRSRWLHREAVLRRPSPPTCPRMSIPNSCRGLGCQVHAKTSLWDGSLGAVQSKVPEGGHLQHNQLARLAERYDGEEEEADDEACKSPEVAGAEDQQTVPSTHYVSPVSLCCRTKSTQAERCEI
jgi:hypothetical protein